jgi:IS5 family transposase
MSAFGGKADMAIALRTLEKISNKLKRKYGPAIALRRMRGVDDARVTNSETLIRRGKKWFRYDAPDKRLFRELQKTLTGR